MNDALSWLSVNFLMLSSEDIVKVEITKVDYRILAGAGGGSSVANDEPSYGNGRCANCGHLSNDHACDHENMDYSCSKCDCDYFKMERSDDSHPPATSWYLHHD